MFPNHSTNQDKYKPAVRLCSSRIHEIDILKKEKKTGALENKNKSAQIT